ncbi:hypothetical protein HWV62_18286 [Athelia sp. TMB]|nr:hypothetical protein HWV62_18286 [Athelia sp. TMB]
MHLDHLLLPRHLQKRCTTPQCNCAADETCYQTSGTGDTCPTVTCVPNSTGGSSGGSSGVSGGAVAGAVIGVLVVLGAVVGLYFWYRRRTAAKDKAIVEVKPDIPAPAEAVLNRPDPSEKLTSRPPTELINSTLRVYSTQSDDTIDLDPESQRSANKSPFRDSAQSNPFSDGNSIQTAGSSGSEGTNVIPIALVTPGASSDFSLGQFSTAPLRPARSPELNLNSDPLNVTRDGVRVPYAQSQISGISATSSRNSYISNMSYSSEMLNEAPVIVTQQRQVIGSVKPEMISASSSGLSSPTSTSSLAPSLKSRPSMRSPLASTSFGPSDVLAESDEVEVPALPNHSPFDDDQVAMRSPGSTTTFGQPTPDITVSHSAPNPVEASSMPYDQPSRPTSVSSQAGSLIAASVIDIGSATRVQVGNAQRSPYRTTMGRLVATKSNENIGTLQQQQQRALAHAHAQAQAQGGDRRRISGSSAMSNTGDSILESFPFVPPSPISNRPIRSPPRSPHSVAGPKSPIPQRPPPPPDLDEPLPAPRDRRTLGMSTGSQLSTASSGLGSFPFQIEHPQHSNEQPPVQGRQRASLDTLALTSDLSTYPLGYDRS